MSRDSIPLSPYPPQPTCHLHESPRSTGPPLSQSPEPKATARIPGFCHRWLRNLDAARQRSGSCTKYESAANHSPRAISLHGTSIPKMKKLTAPTMSFSTSTHKKNPRKQKKNISAATKSRGTNASYSPQYQKRITPNRKHEYPNPVSVLTRPRRPSTTAERSEIGVL